MTFRIVGCLSVAALGFISSASAQNYDYFLPRSSTWNDRNAYQIPSNNPYRAGAYRCGQHDAWSGRDSNFRPANYTYPPTLTTYGTPACASPAYQAPAYPTCNPAPYPAGAAYPGTAVGYPNNDLYVGYGLFGQPRAFARDEPVRNFFRFLFP